MSEIEFEFNFSDLTMLEADGSFEEVKNIMARNEPLLPKSHHLSVRGWAPATDKWTVISDLTIDSNYGLAEMTVHAYHDGRLVITAYRPSVGDVYYNPDIQALSAWAQQNGWKVPEPSEELVKGNIDFWRHYWETLLVDSPYLDSVFGIRPQLTPEGLEDIEEDDIEE